MAISNQTVKTVYNGNGSTTTFPVTFDLVGNSEVEVYLYSSSAATITQQTISTHYTLTGSPATAVEMITAPAVGEKLVVIRKNPLTQAVDYIGAGTFLAEDHEDGMDKIMRVVQEINERVSRSVSFSKQVENPLEFVPEGGKILAVNADADGIELVDLSTVSNTQGMRTVTGSDSILTTDYAILAKASADIVLTLPLAAGAAYAEFTFTHISNYQTMILCSGSDQINEEQTFITLQNYGDSIRLKSSGSGWYIFR